MVDGARQFPYRRHCHRDDRILVAVSGRLLPQASHTAIPVGGPRGLLRRSRDPTGLPVPSRGSLHPGDRGCRPL